MTDPLSVDSMVLHGVLGPSNDGQIINPECVHTGTGKMNPQVCIGLKQTGLSAPPSTSTVSTEQ